MPSIRKRRAAFTLIELLMVVVIVGVLSVLGIELVGDTINEGKFEDTVNRMTQIQNAMIGNPEIREGGLRTSFGFLGDIGAIPTTTQGIASLVTQPGVPLPAFAVSATTRIGIGWNGPYLTGASSATSFTTDGWGRTIAYDPTVNPATLVSLGADGAAGGTGFNQDITFNLPTTMRSTTISGYICQTGGPFKGTNAQVELNYPNGAGVLTQSLATLVTADKGKFSFASVPFGQRSITVYVPSKAAPTTTVGPVLITIDKPNYVVPCNQIDILP